MSYLDDRHLGETAAALVDGELGHDARERALAHLAHCDGCRHEVDDQRSLKARLAGLGGPLPPPGMHERLLVLGVAAPSRPSPPRLPVAGGPVRPMVPAGPGGRPVSPMPAAGPGRPAGRRRRRLTRAAGGASLLVLGLGAALALGGSSGGGVSVDPAVDTFVVEHAVVTGKVPLTDPAVGVVVTTTLTTP